MIPPLILQMEEIRRTQLASRVVDRGQERDYKNIASTLAAALKKVASRDERMWYITRHGVAERVRQNPFLLNYDPLQDSYWASEGGEGNLVNMLDMAILTFAKDRLRDFDMKHHLFQAMKIADISNDWNKDKKEDYWDSIVPSVAGIPKLSMDRDLDSHVLSSGSCYLPIDNVEKALILPSFYRGKWNLITQLNKYTAFLDYSTILPVKIDKKQILKQLEAAKRLGFIDAIVCLPVGIDITASDNKKTKKDQKGTVEDEISLLEKGIHLEERDTLENHVYVKYDLEQFPEVDESDNNAFRYLQHLFSVANDCDPQILRAILQQPVFKRKNIEKEIANRTKGLKGAIKKLKNMKVSNATEIDDPEFELQKRDAWDQRPQEFYWLNNPVPKTKDDVFYVERLPHRAFDYIKLASVHFRPEASYALLNICLVCPTSTTEGALKAYKTAVNTALKDTNGDSNFVFQRLKAMYERFQNNAGKRSFTVYHSRLHTFNKDNLELVAEQTGPFNV